MNIPPDQAKRLSLWEYEAILFEWNESHRIDEGDPPDPDIALPLLDRINADPRLTGRAPPAVN